MHSSRMRTGRSLTVFRSLQPGGGVYLVPGGGVYLVRGGVYLVRGGCTWSRGGVPGPGGVYLVPGGVYCTWSWGGVYCTWSRGGGVPGPGGGGAPGQVLPPPVNRMTNRCKNITLAKTSFRPVTRTLLALLQYVCM